MLVSVETLATSGGHHSKALSERSATRHVQDTICIITCSAEQAAWMKQWRYDDRKNQSLNQRTLELRSVRHSSVKRIPKKLHLRTSNKKSLSYQLCKGCAKLKAGCCAKGCPQTALMFCGSQEWRPLSAVHDLPVYRLKGQCFHDHLSCSLAMRRITHTTKCCCRRYSSRVSRIGHCICQPS